MLLDVARCYQYTVRCSYNAVKFSPKSSQNTPHNSPVRARYGVSFVNITSDAYLASVIVVPYAKWCYAWPYYTGNRLAYFNETGTVYNCPNSSEGTPKHTSISRESTLNWWYSDRSTKHDTVAHKFHLIVTKANFRKAQVDIPLVGRWTVWSSMNTPRH